MNAQTIKEIYKRFHVPPHIAAHMKKVADVAVMLGKRINRREGKRIVNINTLRNAALLHDILKICDIRSDDKIFTGPKTKPETKRVWRGLIKKYKKYGHIAAAVNFLRNIKEPVLAEIVKKHAHDSVISKRISDRPQNWEEKILYYADKRVLHSNIVSIGRRFEDGGIRYAPKNCQKIPKKLAAKEKQIFDRVLKLENEICKKAGIKPSGLNKLLKN